MNASPDDCRLRAFAFRSPNCYFCFLLRVGDNFFVSEPTFLLNHQVQGWAYRSEEDTRRSHLYNLVLTGFRALPRRQTESNSRAVYTQLMQFILSLFFNRFFIHPCIMCRILQILRCTNQKNGHVYKYTYRFSLRIAI